jgi:Rha family phage regulatory protein
MKNEIAVVENIKVFERDGKQWTTSLNVAEVFGKEHFVVLKAIENLECSKAFADNNFIVGEYADKNNQMRKMYEMTRDGFSFLAMGFTGAKAAQFKEAYIEAFNRMEEQIKLQPVRQIDMAELLASINESHRSVIRMLERHDHSLCTIEQKSDKTEKRVDEIAAKQDQMAGDISYVKDDISYVKDKMEGILKRNDLSKPVTQQHEKMIMERFLGNCPCCGDTQIIGKDGKMIQGVAEKEHFFGPSQNKLDQTWITCKKCNRDKRDGKLSMDFIKKKFESYQADLLMNIQKKKKIRAEYEKTMPKQFGIFDFMKACDA